MKHILFLCALIALFSCHKTAPVPSSYPEGDIVGIKQVGLTKDSLPVVIGVRRLNSNAFGWLSLNRGLQVKDTSAVSMRRIWGSGTLNRDTEPAVVGHLRLFSISFADSLGSRFCNNVCVGERVAALLTDGHDNVFIGPNAFNLGVREVSYVWSVDSSFCHQAGYESFGSCMSKIMINPWKIQVIEPDSALSVHGQACDCIIKFYPKYDGNK